MEDVLGQRKYFVGCYNYGYMLFYICLILEDLQIYQILRVNFDVDYNFQ